MFKKTTWHRVAKAQKCFICQRDSWCTYTETVACCMRVKSGKPMKNGGYLHTLGADLPRYLPPIKPSEPTPIIDAPSMWQKWFKSTDSKRLSRFASLIGVECMALYFLGCAWAPEHNAWAFPMKDGSSKVVGIRLRNEDGHKWAVRGSKQGLFIPEIDFQSLMVITEGPTDCSAALTLGFSSIGRPSCLGCEKEVSQVIVSKKVKSVVIVSDNDGPGLAGSLKLQSTLKVPNVLFLLPTKDLREFVSAGGDYATFNSMLKNLCWENPK